METIARTFIIPSRHIIHQEIFFKNASIGKLAVAMKANSAVAGCVHENIFSWQPFRWREHRTVWDGRAIVSLDTTSPGRPYVTTMKAIAVYLRVYCF